jgi:hypothetical protein
MRAQTYLSFVLTALLVGCASQSKVAVPPSSGTAVPAASAASSPATELASRHVDLTGASTQHVVLNMTGAKICTDAKDWTSFKDEWRSTFSDYAKDSNATLSVQEGESRPMGESGVLVTVYVNDYRQVGIGARIFLGVFTGNAYIDAKVTFSDLRTGKVYGDQTYNTSSSAWSGVFAKMTPLQVDSISSEVWHELGKH